MSPGQTVFLLGAFTGRTSSRCSRPRQPRQSSWRCRLAERLAQQSYDAGLQDFLSVMDAQRNAFLARSELLNARRVRLDNRVDLFLSLGGGFESFETIANHLIEESDQP